MGATDVVPFVPVSGMTMDRQCASGMMAIATAAKQVIHDGMDICIGGGVALALCCDLRICGEGSQFAIPAAKLGLGYGYPGLKRLVDVVGPSFAKEIFFTARRFDAEEARTMGLVNRVVEDGTVAQAAEDTAAMIAANAPMTVESIKFIVGEVLKDESARDLAECDARVKACFASQDYIEGRRAFLEKRKPQFIGA